MHQIHLVVKIPEHDGFSPGFEVEQIFDVAQIGNMQHEIISPAFAELLVQAFSQGLEMQIC